MQSHDFPSAHSRAEFQEEQFIEICFFCFGKEFRQLVLAQHLHLLCFLWRYLTADGGIDFDESFHHRLFQRRSAGGMARSRHAVGESRAVSFHQPFSSVAFQSCAELLQIVLCQSVQRYFTNVGDDVIVYSVFVVLLCQWSDGGLGIVLVPEVDPIIEGHLRLAPRTVRRPRSSA